MTVVHCSKQVNFTRCGLHSHQNWEVIVRLKGNTQSIIGQQVCAVVENDVVVIPPGILHGDESNDICTDISFSLDVMDFSGVMHLHDHSGNIRNLAELLYQTYLVKESNFQNIVNGLGETIYQYIKRISVATEHTPFVYELKNALFQNVSNPYYDISAEIEKTGFHPDYVRRCFKAETGRSPLAYLTNLRLSKAKQMLLESPHETVSNIATQCGFQDSLYFSTCFKKHTGVSPQQYRKNHIK